MFSDVVYKSLDFLGFPKHRIGDDGSVWSYRMDRHRRYRWKVLKTKTQHCKCTSYKRIHLKYEDKTLLVFVHCLVLTAFIGPAPPGMVACHFPNKNGSDNRLTNLMWGTPKTNWLHRVAHGTDNSGTKNCNAKLSQGQARRIRDLWNADHGLSGRAFAKKHAAGYGVSPETIRSLISGTSYRLE